MKNKAETGPVGPTDLTRRRLLIAAAVAAPVAAWGGTSGSPPAAGTPIAGGNPAPVVNTQVQTDLANLKARLDRMAALESQAEQVLRQYQDTFTTAPESEERKAARAMERERLRRANEQMAAMLENELERVGVEMSVAKIEQLAAAIAHSGTGKVECAAIGNQLLAAGFIDGALNAAIAAGRHRWTTESVRAALARARATIARLKIPAVDVKREIPASRSGPAPITSPGKGTPPAGGIPPT